MSNREEIYIELEEAEYDKLQLHLKAVERFTDERALEARRPNLVLMPHTSIIFCLKAYNPEG